VNRLNLKPALRYQLTSMSKAAAMVFAIVFAVAVFLHVIVGVFIEPEATINIAGIASTEVDETFIRVNQVNFGFVAIIFLFVVGVGGIREDLKLMLQHGMGRRTVYVSTLLGSLISSAALGIFCELLNLVTVFSISGLNFQGGFFSGVLLHTLSFFLAWQLGTLISMIYYRLETMQKIIFSVLGGALIVFGIPRTITRLLTHDAGAFEATLINIFTNPFALVLPILVCGVLAATGNFLLLRRAQVRE